MHATYNSDTISVLLVEDNPADIHLIKAYASESTRQHYDITSVGRLSDAMEQSSTGDFDIVLLDLGLPDSQGLNGVRKLNESFPRIPIVILTGLDDESVAMAAIHAGAQDYIWKNSVSGELLERIIRYAIDRKKREVALASSQKLEALGTLASGIAHDFNNLLSPIVAFSDIIMRSNDVQPRINKMAQRIWESAEHAHKIVEQILLFSKSSSIEQESIPLRDLLSSNINILRSSIPEYIEIRSTLCEDDLIVNGDRSRLSQVLLNLGTNAYHAMGKNNGTLTLTVIPDTSPFTGPDQQVQFVMIRISDTGCGMDAATLERIFDPFFTTKAEGEGTGLGLSIVHGIIEEMGGSIKVESQQNQGTTFEIKLPQGKAERIDASAASPVFANEPNGLTALVVDDQPHVLECNSIMLNELGYDTVQSEMSIEALNLFQNEPQKFALVMTDMTMPDMSGIELATKISHIRDDIPILVASGNLENDTISRLRELGNLDYIKKPFTVEKLAEALHVMSIK